MAEVLAFIALCALGWWAGSELGRGLSKGVEREIDGVVRQQVALRAIKAMADSGDIAGATEAMKRLNEEARR